MALSWWDAPAGQSDHMSEAACVKDAPAGRVYYKVHLNHMKGGHSGMEINLGRGNANQQLCRFLFGRCGANMTSGSRLSTEVDLRMPFHERLGLWWVLSLTAVQSLRRMWRYSPDMIHAEFRPAEGDDFTLVPLSWLLLREVIDPE